MIKYQCTCGGEMQLSIVATIPPIKCYRCAKCGRHIDERESYNETIIVK